jgi:flagellar biosynthesis/type III secretory pathway chaperone
MSENNEPAAAPVASPQGRRMGRRLLALLNQELVVQHRLLAVATQTCEAIVERDVAALGALREQHAKLLDEADRLAAARMEASRDIARIAGVPLAGLTLSQVADCCPGDVALQIGATGHLFVEVVMQVQNAHFLNRQLLENELDYIGASLEVLARAAAPRKDYAAPLQRLDAHAIILDKAA